MGEEKRLNCNIERKMKKKNDNECVWMRECIEEVMKLSLESESDILNLSPEFCSNLLKLDPTNPSPSHSLHSLEGVPLYPLYKHLASSLLRFLDSHSFCYIPCNSPLSFEDTFMHHKHNHWHKLILDKGSQLLNILRSVSFELHVQEPFFSHLKDGQKTIEGRCATSKYSRIELGDLILINKSVVFEVQGIRQYPTFSDMLEAERLEKVLPGVESVEEGLEVYRRFYTEEKELVNGVLAISVSKVALQPYILVANLFSGLSYEGVQGLLGLMHTTGTSLDALPPSKSTLLASFNLPCNPNVKSSTLTHGARALAKHACRSSNGYWGSLVGSGKVFVVVERLDKCVVTDSNKNRLAMNVIDNLIGHCRWMNLHAVSPHGVVFEIRVADGYGARWTEDGSKFIGFLEPYMRDGHSKGWKH